MSPLDAHYTTFAKDWVSREELHHEAGLNRLLEAMARWRSKRIARAIVQRDGAVIQAGPFAGMGYHDYATFGCLAPVLLGSYEQELHPHILALRDAGLKRIVDIGCAEGHYAVGLARLLPDVVVHAYDVDPRAQAACARLAAMNGVEDRVKVAGLFRGEDFAAVAGVDTLVMMDAEGAEDDLLDPQAWPALQTVRLIVETHDIFRPGVKDRLVARFAPSHHIEVVENAPRLGSRPEWLTPLSGLDQLIAMWEWRRAPTPWLVMSPR